MAGPKILLVEDEEVLTRVLLRSLPKSWRVHAETDSRVALKRLLDGEEFDVIVLDLMIPHLTGMALFTELQEKAPHLCSKVLFSTGARYIPAVDVFLSGIHKAPPLIEKPFRINEIIAAIKGVMKAGKQNGSEPDEEPDSDPDAAQ